MNTLMQLKDFQTVFLPSLELFFEQQRQKVSHLWPLAKDMFEKLAEFTLRGGKRVRPALLYYGYQGISNEDPLKLVPLCIACELMQSFLLIHDDIMDQSTIRRGGKTIHQQFQVSYPYYGESMAILIGNLAGYLGIQAIAASDFEVLKKNQIMDLYAQICMDAGYGQALDISFDALENLTEKNIYNIYRYKTARYTTEFPLLTAAILASCSEDSMSLIRKIAVDLGIIFQVKDDMLGLLGDDKTMGKPLDSIQHKKTLLIYKAFEMGNVAQKEQLKAVYEQMNITASEIAMVKKIMQETGAFAYATEMIEKRTASILKLIEALQLRPIGKGFLKDLICYCGHRDN